MCILLIGYTILSLPYPHTYTRSHTHTPTHSHTHTHTPTHTHTHTHVHTLTHIHTHPHTHTHTHTHVHTRTHTYTHTQRELKLLNTKPEFVQLLNHCQKNCGGMKLTELLQLPADRVSQSTISRDSSVLYCAHCIHIGVLLYSGYE